MRDRGGQHVGTRTHTMRPPTVNGATRAAAGAPRPEAERIAPAGVPPDGLTLLLGATRRRLGLLAAACRLAVAVALLPAAAPLARAQDAPEPPAAETASAVELPELAQGSLVYRSPVSGRYELVPLEYTDVDVDVRGVVAAATVTQRFSNPTDTPLEAVYVFPLPHAAAVYDMEARVGERVIRAVVTEREEAARTYQAARAEGRRAALVEQERPNLFTTSLANILPGERIEVRLRYVGPLAWEGGRVRLTFPMVVGPRYIPGNRPVGHQGTGWAFDTNAVPDASRITPPVRAPERRPGHDIGLRVRLEAGEPLESLGSPSHAVRNSVAADGATVVDLAAGVTLPNRDFVLEYRLAPPRGPQAALFLSPSTDEGSASGDQGRHFLLAAFPPAAESASERPPLEMVFLIDVSGSMAGTSIEQARAALLQGLDRLTPGDRVHVVAYNHGFFAFRPEPRPATAEALSAARGFVSGLHADGGTEMLPALESVLALPQTPGYLRHIVLLTDGCLGNEDQIFAALERGLGDARLFTVAIGSAPNHYLAANMAQFGRGSFTPIADGSEVRAQMARLLDQISSPVLTDVRLTWHGVTAEDVLPARLPDLFRGQPLLVYGRLAGGGPGTLEVEGRAGLEPFRQEIAVEPRRARFHPGLTTLWARAKVDELMDLWREAPEGPERDARRGDVLALAIRHHLVTPFTSLVAVEDTPAHGEGAPRTAVVPTELPAGWQMDKVFGANPQGGTADLFLETLGAALLLAGAGVVALRAWPGARA